MKKETATITAAAQTQRKGSNNNLLTQVLSIFKNGEQVTAKELNNRLSFNDSRKAISVLRQKGYNIIDSRQLDRRKIYSLAPDRQLSLF